MHAFHFAKMGDPPVPSSTWQAEWAPNLLAVDSYNPGTQAAPEPSSDLCAVAQETWED